MGKEFQFVNPYNFIPSGKKIDRIPSKEAHDLNGIIEYELLTKTPLFIPNTSCNKVFSQTGEPEDHKSHDFFSYNDLSGVTDIRGRYYAPVIPGSEIRGMFRSSFEILTNSCMSSLNAETLLSKRTMTSFEAALLYRTSNGGFQLYKAEDLIWRTKGENDPETEMHWDDRYYNRKCYIQEDFPEGCKVSFKVKTREKGKPLAYDVERCIGSGANGKYTGYLIKGMPGPEIRPSGGRPSPQKHSCHIFKKKNDCVAKFDIAEIKELLVRLKHVLEIYQNNAEAGKPYAEYHREYNRFLKGEGEDCFPVYYSMVKEGAKANYYLSPACKTRELYKTNLQKLSKDFAPCKDLDNLCEACGLFGTIVNGNGKASRLRFTDLALEEQKDYADCYYKPVTLKPLSGPKPSNVEFYLKKPENAIFWTYEYYVDGNHQVHVCDGELAGRKFYWHNVKHFDWKDCEADERTKLNSTVRPVKTGNKFTGKIYFEGLSQTELKKLVYIINAGDFDSVDQKAHGYKLGTAKPLGFGSVACSVNAVNIRHYIIENGTVECKMTDVLEEYRAAECYRELFDKEVQINFEKMTGFDSINSELESGYKYSYPQVTDGGDIFAWFQDNHKGWRFDKKCGVNKLNSFPNKREEQCMRLYMRSMEPVLRKNEKVR